MTGTVWQTSIRLIVLMMVGLSATVPSAWADSGAVSIVSPGYDSEHTFGEKIYLTSSTRNKAGEEITKASFVWTSSLDGNIGTGASVIVNSLSVGLHRITLDVSGPSGSIGSDTIKIKVSLAKTGGENDNPSDFGIGTGKGNYVPNPFN